MIISKLEIQDALLIKHKSINDERGRFVKHVLEHDIKTLGLKINWNDEFHTHSMNNVFRGFHFQRNEPLAYKLVHFFNGACTDFLYDLRPGSSSYKKLLVLDISSEDDQSLLIPPNVAHAFLSKSDNLITFYKVGCHYKVENDAGFNYKSLNINLPKSLIVSKRDLNLPFLNI